MDVPHISLLSYFAARKRHALSLIAVEASQFIAARRDGAMFSGAKTSRDHKSTVTDR